ncbi:MAG TPA: T9SS type A sorting domain-containing protein [Flavobacterium sp.]|nr:T9SS type A sorting domain-containing protein [Flavobacterium sp.]
MKKKLLFILLTSSFFTNAQFWAEKATGFDTPSRSLNSISIVDANVIWANAFDNSDLINPNYNVKEFTLSIDGGNTWTSKSFDSGINTADLGISSISAISAITAWVSVFDDAGSTGGIWKTVDGGTNWTKQPTALFNSSKSYPNFVYFWDANNGITMGDPDGLEFEIYTTIDGGTTWTRVPGDNIPDANGVEEWGYFSLYSVSGNTIWFGTNKGRIFKSSDKGLTWKAYISVANADFGVDKFTFSNETKGLLMIENTQKLYNTTDGGVTWNPVITPDFYKSDIAYIPGTSIVVAGAAANPFGSSYSIDDGVTWTVIDNGIYHGTLAFLNDSFGFSAGLTTNATTGGISKFTGIPPLKTQKFDAEKQISAYPNPTNGILHLDSEFFQIKETKLFDLLGRQVFDLKFQPLNKVTLDLNSLQSGLYLLQATSDSGKTETMKIMKN